MVDEATEPVGISIPPAEPETPSSDVAERLDSVTGRVERLEKQFGDFSDELAGVDLDRDAQHALARSLDAVEQDVMELHREMLDRLDREEGVVTGVLLSEEGEGGASRGGVRAVRGRVRVARPGAGPAVGAGDGYLLGHRVPDVRKAVGRPRRGPVLVRARPVRPAGRVRRQRVAHRVGVAARRRVAQFGPFVAVSTQSALLCGVLPDEGTPPTEPWQLVDHIRELPADRQRDLSWLRSED